MIKQAYLRDLVDSLSIYVSLTQGKGITDQGHVYTQQSLVLIFNKISVVWLTL